MRITTKGRYALRAVVNLAAISGDKPVPIKQIAEVEEISPEFLEQIFFRLKKSGLIRSVRGPGGGFILDRNPKEITIKDIFEAVGEGVDLTPCSSCGNDLGTCNRMENCLIHEVWTKITSEVSTLFESFTLQSILESRQRRKIAVNQ